MRWKPEKDIQAEIVKFLKQDPGIFFKVIHTQGIIRHDKNGNRFLAPNSMKGMADIYTYIDKQFTLWIEVKSAIGALSLEQKEFRKDVESHDQYFLVARSVADVKEFLEQTVRADLG
jgi:hypothetical protein